MTEASLPAPFRLRTLGALSLRRDGGPELEALVVQPKRIALLCYLVCRTRTGFLRRDTLLGVFWPHLDDHHARTALRQSLYQLKIHLGDDVIDTRGSFEVRVDHDRVHCDAVAFLAAARSGDTAAAVELYRGPFLEGFFLPGASEFEAWVESERRLLEDRFADMLRQAAEGALQSGEPARAIEHMRRLARLRPFSSRTITSLMKLYAQIGDLPAAIRVARMHADYLQKELGTSPDPAVGKLAEELQRKGIA